MTTQQPEALRIARTLEQNPNGKELDKAAAELRRLHEENEQLVQEWREVLDSNVKRGNEIVLLRAINAQLLEALEKLSLYVAHNGDDWVQREARAAIKAAKGEA